LSSSFPMIVSAAERVLHFADALRWFHEKLHHSPDFQLAFTSLANSFVNAANETRPEAPGQVFFVAVGKSAGVAQLLVSMLASIGVQARFLHPTEALHGDLGALAVGDSVVCISNNGKSSEILELLPYLKARSCLLYVMTSKESSPLAQNANHVLLLPPVEEKCPLNQAPITSTVMCLALGQLLVAACMEIRSLDLAAYARNHPGGAIGKRIFVKVDDLMAKGARLPAIRPEAPFMECVSKMTQFALAGLLVVNEGKLAGLVSEKDLRRAMETHGADVFKLLAHEIMNAKPIVAHSGTLAVDALKMMENRPSPLNILPIVDAEHNAVGLLRLHDLVSEGISLV
jgi:arabinose-5-phosphate isomerase